MRHLRHRTEGFLALLRVKQTIQKVMDWSPGVLGNWNLDRRLTPSAGAVSSPVLCSIGNANLFSIRQELGWYESHDCDWLLLVAVQNVEKQRACTPIVRCRCHIRL